MELGVEKSTWTTLLARADLISIHTPLTEANWNILSRRRDAPHPQGRADCQSRPRRPDRRSRPGRGDHLGPRGLSGPRRVRNRTGVRNRRCSALATSSTPRTSAPPRPRRRRTSRFRSPSRSATSCSPVRWRCDQHALGYRRGRAAPEPYMELCRLLGPSRGHFTQAREGVDPPRPHRIRRPRGGAEAAPADGGGAGRADVADDGGVNMVIPGRGARARHRRRRDGALPPERIHPLLRVDHRAGPADPLAWRARCSPVLGRAWSRSRASPSRPISPRTCPT